MKNEHTHQWAVGLRTTSSPQVHSRLAANLGNGVVGFCCLGLGCELAGIERDRAGTEYAYDGTTGLPPARFHQWLGLDPGAHVPPPPGHGHDVAVDWDLDLYGYDMREYHDDDDMRTYASLNDNLALTFPQIADIVDHFGVIE